MKRQEFFGGEALARAVERAYEAGQIDYSLEPLNLENGAGEPVGVVQKGDAVIFCCRRGEREIELTDAFTDPAFSGFAREKLDPLTFVILTMYSEKYTYVPVAFAPGRVSGTLAETVAAAGKTQFHVSESEKYAHVTFFLNGGNGKPFAAEDDVCVPSPKGVPFDAVPALSLPEVAERVCGGIGKGYDLIVTNFANGDVIGHTANDRAKIETACIVDAQLRKVVTAARAAGYTTFITADHGNLEMMRDPETGQPHTAHTVGPVPLVYVGERQAALRSGGALRDIAPTLLDLLGLPQPAEMSGRSLLSPA